MVMMMANLPDQFILEQFWKAISLSSFEVNFRV
jgi:hypothetical protein